MMLYHVAWVLLSAGTGLAAGQDYEKNLPTDHPAIGYWGESLDDPVARLKRTLEAENPTLLPDEVALPSLLAHLGVPIDSQTLVFSKTSLQQDRISPRTPRAIYFADDVAVGYVPGSDVVEMAATDPERGTIFYTLTKSGFARPQGCLRCHQGAATLGVPGVYVGSVTTSSSGRPDFRLGSVVTDHRTPFEERWGGWYVNGLHGAERHRGNAVALDPAFATMSPDAETQNLVSLVRRIDTSRYPAPVSDLVALMTLEHQTQMTNLLTRLAWEARLAGAASLDARIEEVARYLLFADETPLRDPIEGVSTFTQTFPRRGPHDEKGRTLREFDRRTRLFRYPLSYLIYSDLFDALPPPVLEALYARLYEALTNPESMERRSPLPDEDRRAIVEIVRATKPRLPAGWR